jgi:glycosyltransferase involved in cell wall biosynthesis
VAQDPPRSIQVSADRMIDQGSAVRAAAKPFPGEHLDFSLLIATRERSSILQATLCHLERQNLDGARWELIVVDNGSRDSTACVLEEARSRLPLVALREEKPGKNRALNRALAVAKGELLVFSDDDVIPRPDWLGELLRASRRWPDHAIFGGRVDPDYPEGTPDWLKEHAFAGWAFTRFVPKQTEGVLPASLIPVGPNLAIRASRLLGDRFCENIGPRGSNYAMGGESELIYRLMARGELCVYVPTAVVKHVVGRDQLQLQWLFRRSFRAGRGIARLTPDRASPRIFGVPRYLWRMLGASGFGYVASLAAGFRQRFEAGIAFHSVRGQIHEYRILNREEAT